MVFTVVDIETTGLSKKQHAIIEIAAAKIRNGKITKTFQTLVNPNTRIPRFITSFTGIDDEMVKDAPKITKALPEFLEFLNDDIFVAHNARFDFGFCDHNLKLHYQRELLNQTLCTRKLANRLYPELPSKRLGAICEYLDVRNEEEHRALGDVKATAEIFKQMLDKLEKKDVYKTEDIIKFERSSIKRI